MSIVAGVSTALHRAHRQSYELPQARQAWQCMAPLARGRLNPHARQKLSAFSALRVNDSPILHVINAPSTTASWSGSASPSNFPRARLVARLSRACCTLGLT